MQNGLDNEPPTYRYQKSPEHGFKNGFCAVEVVLVGCRSEVEDTCPGKHRGCERDREADKRVYYILHQRRCVTRAAIDAVACEEAAGLRRSGLSV
jgi:hypothetical protein